MPFLSHSPEDTQAHAVGVAANCTTGTVLRLHGDLGAGKTTWVQGLVTALGSPTEATSPSFALLHEYTGGSLPVFHWDLYRLAPETDWSVLDLPDHLPAAGITIVEWPERYPGPWPHGNVHDIRITLNDDGSRLIAIDSKDAKLAP